MQAPRQLLACSVRRAHAVSNAWGTTKQAAVLNLNHAARRRATFSTHARVVSAAPCCVSAYAGQPAAQSPQIARQVRKAAVLPPWWGRIAAAAAATCACAVAVEAATSDTSAKCASVQCACSCPSSGDCCTCSCKAWGGGAIQPAPSVGSTSCGCHAASDAAAAPGSSPPRSLATPPHRPLVFVVGDSISIDYGQGLERALRGTARVARKGATGPLLANRRARDSAEFDPHNTGVQAGNGGDSFDVLRYLKHLASEPDRAYIDVLVLNCGLHDIKRYTSCAYTPQVTLAAYQSNVDEILRVAKEQLGARHVVWVNSTPVNGAWDHSKHNVYRRVGSDVRVYNAAAAAVCASHDVPVVDLYSLSSALGPTAYRDHVHFTERASDVQARCLARELRRVVGEDVLPSRATLVQRRKLISDDQWAHFRREGWVVLPKEQVFADDAEFQALRDHIDDVMLGVADVPYDAMMMQLDSSTGRYEDSGAQTLGHKGTTLKYRKIQNLDLSPRIMAYLRHPLFEEACERVYGRGTPISSFRTMFFNKPARQGTNLPWHQDRWRFLDRDPILNVYLALDEATPASGCMQIVPWSHERGVVNPDHHSGFLTPEQVEAHCGKGQKVMDFTLRPGEVALMHNWIIHRSGTNVTDKPRRALSISFMDARSRLDSRSFDQFLGKELRTTGYPEGGTSFPVIFDKSNGTDEAARAS